MSEHGIICKFVCLSQTGRKRTMGMTSPRALYTEARGVPGCNLGLAVFKSMIVSKV